MSRNNILQWRFLIHLWTLAGLGFAMIAAQRTLEGDLDAAARWLLLVLVVDHSDGTLARAFDVRGHLPRISGETLDLITDVVGLTFVPMLFCWRAEVFLPGWGAPLALVAAVTCSYKYAQKSRVLERKEILRKPNRDPTHPSGAHAFAAGRQAKSAQVENALLCCQW